MCVVVLCWCCVSISVIAMVSILVIGLCFRRCLCCATFCLCVFVLCVLGLFEWFGFF